MAVGLIRHVFTRINANACERIIRIHRFSLPTSTFAIQNMASVRKFSSAADRFEDAKLKLKTLTEEPSDETKLKLYSLFKQATVGSCTSSRPSVLDFVGRAKWDAWNSLGSMNQDEAKLQYANLIDGLLGERSTSDSSAIDNTAEAPVLVTKQNNVTTITLNRPKKKNALTPEMYDDIVAALKNAADDNDNVITVITGSGDYYCSGNDLSNFTKSSGGNIEEIARASKLLLKRFVGAFIDFPKVLVAAVNGPAVGISVTTMALYDLVYATDKATFSTPFSNVGQSPEGCSSYIFPRLMGYSKANEMLLFNKKITAAEAKDIGLVAEVFPESTFAKEVESRVQNMSKLPKNCLIYSKKLIRDVDRELLHKVNEEECERLVERWQSSDCLNAVMAFLQRKSAL